MRKATNFISKANTVFRYEGFIPLVKLISDFLLRPLFRYRTYYLFEYTFESSYNLNETDFIPRNCLSIEAEQLISACFTGWVFGGMGSWNDMAFGREMEEEYHRVSDLLYTAICNAIVAAVNSYP